MFLGENPEETNLVRGNYNTPIMMMNLKQGQAHGNNLNVIHESTALRPQGILFVSLCLHRPCKNSGTPRKNKGFGTFFFRIQGGNCRLILLCIALVIVRLLQVSCILYFIPNNYLMDCENFGYSILFSTPPSNIYSFSVVNSGK